jgi:uncharacterized protein (DUF58 family)
MRFGTRVAFKSVVAAQAAALLAWAAADRGDRVGGLVFDEQGRFEHRPAACTQGLLPLLQALAGGGRAVGATGLGDVTVAADQLVHLARPGSLIFILSDFNDLIPEHSAWLARLGRVSEVVLVHVRDPLEEVAPPPASIRSRMACDGVCWIPRWRRGAPPGKSAFAITWRCWRAWRASIVPICCG